MVSLFLGHWVENVCKYEEERYGNTAWYIHPIRAGLYISNNENFYEADSLFVEW